MLRIRTRGVKFWRSYAAQERLVVNTSIMYYSHCNGFPRPISQTVWQYKVTSTRSFSRPASVFHDTALYRTASSARGACQQGNNLPTVRLLDWIPPHRVPICGRSHSRIWESFIAPRWTRIPRTRLRARPVQQSQAPPGLSTQKTVLLATCSCTWTQHLQLWDQTFRFPTALSPDSCSVLDVRTRRKQTRHGKLSEKANTDRVEV